VIPFCTGILSGNVCEIDSGVLVENMEWILEFRFLVDFGLDFVGEPMGKEGIVSETDGQWVDGREG